MTRVTGRRVLTLGLLYGSTRALLSPAAAAPSARSQTTEKHREHFERGIAHFDLEEYPQALEQFKEAYRLRSDPALLYNIGRCHHKMGQRAEALSFYKKYLTKGRSVANEDLVKKWIAELETPVAAPPVSSPAPPPQPTAVAPRRAVVFALSAKSDRALAKQFREALEQALGATGRAVVPFQAVAPLDAEILSVSPKPGDPSWKQATTRTRLDEIAICRLHNAGLIRGFARAQYTIDVEVYDGAGERRRTFKVELPNSRVDDGVRAALARAVK